MVLNASDANTLYTESSFFAVLVNGESVRPPLVTAHRTVRPAAAQHVVLPTAGLGNKRKRGVASYGFGNYALTEQGQVRATTDMAFVEAVFVDVACMCGAMKWTETATMGQLAANEFAFQMRLGHAPGSTGHGDRCINANPHARITTSERAAMKVSAAEPDVR